MCLGLDWPKEKSIWELEGESEMVPILLSASWNPCMLWLICHSPCGLGQSPNPQLLLHLCVISFCFPGAWDRCTSNSMAELPASFMEYVHFLFGGGEKQMCVQFVLVSFHWFLWVAVCVYWYFCPPHMHLWLFFLTISSAALQLLYNP